MFFLKLGHRCSVCGQEHRGGRFCSRKGGLTYKKEVESARWFAVFLVTFFTVSAGLFAHFFLPVQSAWFPFLVLIVIGQLVRNWGVPFLWGDWHYISHSIPYVTFSAGFAFVAGSTLNIYFIVLNVILLLYALLMVDDKVTREFDVLDVYR